MKKALENIRIIDLSRILAGPYCTQMLGDLGAEIIKIEKPEAGDDTRKWGPPFLKDKNDSDTNESAYYLSTNRNKKSVAIDIKTEQGQALIHQLLENADVIIENFKVGGLNKYGLGFEQIKEKHPHIVYCSITGFGQNGPLASEPGYDFLAQAMGGLMAITGEPDGQPMKIGVALSDIITGLNASVSILAALRAREQTGKGQHIDLALLDCTLASLSNVAQYYLTSGKVAARQGNAHATIVPYQAFETKDGYIIIAVGNDEQFKRFCDVIGKAEWADDEQFKTNSARVKNREILVPMIKDIMLSQTTEGWLEQMREADVPAGPVNALDKVFAMEQIQKRDMQINMDHEEAKAAISLVGSPLKLSETPVSYDHAPPFLGQHTQEILEKLLGLGADEVAKLEEDGIIEVAKT